MEIVIGKHSGFCYGVKRAVDIALREAECNGKRVYTLGPIIHNSIVVDELAEKGVVAVHSLTEIEKGGVVVIPVSYTHLDVYKRQGASVPLLGQFQWRLMPNRDRKPSIYR